MSGPLPELLSHFDAQLGNTSGHLNSTTPTDSIWLAPSLSILDSGSIPVISDHTGAFVSLEKTRKSGVEPQSWEFQKHATPVSSQLPSSPNVEIWRQVATTDLEWTQVLEDPDRAWQLWSTSAEEYLKLAGVLHVTPGAHPRGSCPRLVPSASRNAPGQSLTERQLRRCLRRIEELKVALKQNPAHVPLGLTNSCLKSFRFSDGTTFAIPLSGKKVGKEHWLSSTICLGGLKLILCKLGKLTLDLMKEHVNGSKGAPLLLGR